MFQLQLIKWKSKTGLQELRIVRDAAPSWETVGALLALGHAELVTFRKKHMGDPDQCIREVFNRWLTNGRQLENAAAYPVSWKGLHGILCDSELHELSAMLCEALEANLSTLKKNLPI